MYFAKNLRFLRRRAELSQSDLGDKIATDYNTISRYESGKSTPKLEALTKLAQVFEVSLEELRNVDLTTSPRLAKAEEPGKLYGREERPPSAAPVKSARHPITISVELDGTAASLARAVARLTAMNDVVAAID